MLVVNMMFSFSARRYTSLSGISVSILCVICIFFKYCHTSAYVEIISVYLFNGHKWRFSTAWYGTVQFSTAHFWGVYNWVQYLVSGTFLKRAISVD